MPGNESGLKIRYAGKKNWVSTPGVERSCRGLTCSAHIIQISWGKQTLGCVDT